jgi:hypothetical protein
LVLGFVNAFLLFLLLNTGILKLFGFELMKVIKETHRAH